MLHTTHPGEHLAEFLKDYEITAYKLAKDINVQQSRISEILSAKRSITAETAAKLGAYFDMRAQFWLDLQSAYDLAMLDQQAIKSVVPLSASR